MDILFSTRDGHQCVNIISSAIIVMKNEMGKHLPNETGGVLIGKYDRNLRLATIHIATSAPDDSDHGRAFFKRGIKSVLNNLKALQSKRKDLHYLGEWHTHPYNKPTPSKTDNMQMNKFAFDKLYGISSPILIIVGGTPENILWNVSIHLHKKSIINLEEI